MFLEKSFLDGKSKGWFMVQIELDLKWYVESSRL